MSYEDAYQGTLFDLIYSKVLTPNTSQCGASNGIALDLRNLTPTEMDVFLYSERERIILYTLLPIIFVVGVLSNIAFIFVIIRVPNLQTATNCYLVNKSVCDISLLVVATGIYSYNFAVSPLRNDNPLFTVTNLRHSCTIFWGFIYTMYFVSILFISVVTAERYAAICFPLKHRIVAGNKHTTRLTISCWIISIALAIGTVFRDNIMLQFCVIWPSGHQFESFPRIVTYCQPSYPLAIVSEFILVIPFIMALISNVCMHWHVIYTLNKRVNSTTYSTKQVNVATDMIQVRNQVARMLIITGTIFFWCHAPYRLQSVQAIVVYYTGYRIFNVDQYGLLFLISNLLVIVNSATNVFGYYLSSSHYRRGFKEAFCGKA